MLIHEQDFSPINDHVDLTAYERLGDVITFTIKNTPELINSLQEYYDIFSRKLIDKVFLIYITTEKSFMLYLQFSDWDMKNITHILRLSEEEAEEGCY